MTEIDIAHLKGWIGRSEDMQDTIVASHAARIAALLDRPTTPQEGDPLPPLWHWCYFAPTARQSELGSDGHPRLGGFMPPVPLPRRMWAGGRLTFHAPLRIGDTVTRRTEIVSVTEKSGRQGALVFLTLRHSLSTADGPALEEEQDIVYREPSLTRQPAPLPEGVQAEPADWRDPYAPDAPKLFRYSALTFNTHRIHYDLPYATGVEGYPGLVVHGPLTATLLMEACLRHTGTPPRRFAFRGQAPLFVDGAMSLCGRTADGGGHALWAEGPGGYTAMTASVSPE